MFAYITKFPGTAPANQRTRKLFRLKFRQQTQQLVIFGQHLKKIIPTYQKTHPVFDMRKPSSREICPGFINCIENTPHKEKIPAKSQNSGRIPIQPFLFLPLSDMERHKIITHYSHVGHTFKIG